MAKSLQVAAQRLLGSRSVLLELSESFSVFARSSTGLQQANAGISSSTNTRSPSSASIPCMGSRFAPTTGGSAAAGQQLWQPHAAAISPAAATVSATGAWPAQLLRSFSSSPAHNSQCDCPTLGGPQPDVVMVEYDEEEVDRFIALADAIEEAFPSIVVEGNPDGPGRQGAFEVTGANGALLFSKLAAGAWPQPEQVVTAISSAAEAAAAGAGDVSCALPAQQQ